MFDSGPASARLMLLGEAPGANEDASGIPFCGASGRLLDAALAAAGTSRSEVYVSNAVKCRPPENRPPRHDELEACRPFLHEQLTLAAPRVVCTLGASALQALGITPTRLSDLRGRPLAYEGRIVVPTVHPAYVLRRRRTEWEPFVSDLTLALGLAQ